MNSELKLISAALSKRAAYEEANKYSLKEYLSDQSKVIWKQITEYYERDSEAVSVDKDIIKESVDRLYPKHSKILCQVIDNLEEVSIPNVLHDVIETRKEAVRHDLAAAFASGKDAGIEELLHEYHALSAGEVETGESTSVVVAPNVSSLVASRSDANRIAIRPAELTLRLDGGPLRGHHIVVFAPTDMGKTLFVINAIRGFVEDGHTVLYCGNEDPQSDIIERFLISLTGKSKKAIRNYPDKAQEFAEKAGWHRVIWADLAPGTIGEITGLVQEYAPDVLIVDQIRNLETKAENRTHNYETIAKSIRNIGKKYNLVAISVTQAGDSATGKVVLNRGDIDGSNVGIPGTADAMIGIGATDEQEFEGIRTFSFPKNKIGGDKTPFQAVFNTSNMRIE